MQSYLTQLTEHDQLIRTSFDRHQTRAHRRSSTSTSPEPQLTPGQVFGSYTIENKIGEGGMGHVYHARHVTMDRDVALKVLTPKLMDSPDAVARFHREIKAAAKLQHPNIVTAFDAGEQDGFTLSGDGVCRRSRSLILCEIQRAVESQASHQMYDSGGEGTGLRPRTKHHSS